MAGEQILRILLVEDDEIDRLAIERLVKQEGLPYELVMAPTVAEAVAQLRQGGFDLALIDYKLPDGTGLEVQKQAGETPCICITVATGQAVAVEAMKAGAYDFLVKDSQRDYLQLLPAVIQMTLKRRQAQAQIELQQRIINSLGEITLLLDETGDVVYANAAVEQLLGYRPEEVLGSGWRNLIFPDAAQQREMKARARGEQPPLSYDLELPHKDGRKVWIAWMERYEPGGGLVCVGRDITERVRAEQELREYRDRLEELVAERTAELTKANEQLQQEITERKRAEAAKELHRKTQREREEHFRSVVETAGDAIITINSQGNIVFWNAGAEIIFGYSHDEITGQPLVLILPERFHEAHRNGMKRALSTGKSNLIGKTIELTGLRKDGLEFPLGLSLAMWKTDGEIFFTGIIRDITERVRAEEQIKAALAEKEVLLREIHHRVKNNLQSIISLIGMQTEAIRDPAALQTLGALQRRVRAMGMIHEKLYQAPDLARIDFGDYLEDLSVHLRYALATGRDIALRVDAAHLPVDVNVAIPCGMIVNELVTNALKYAFPSTGGEEKGGREIRVAFGWRDGEYVLAVEDNGTGLPPEVDWRATKSLGLRLVNAWATHQLGGSLEVETHHDKGTTFKIIFSARRKRR